MEPRSEFESTVVFPYVTFLALASVSAAAGASGRHVPAIFVFGDSTADVGSNNHLHVDELTRANYAPNGIDYPGGKPTGRFCNGYIAVDFLAMKMGFKDSPPAYLSHRHGFRGANFASGGSGVLDETGAGKCFPLKAQISFFEEMAKKLASQKGAAASRAILSKSIFILSTANNDMFEYYSGARTAVPAREDFISSISDQFTSQLARLYDLGARKFVVFGVSLLGCTPKMRLQTPLGECVEELNELSLLFNDAMTAKLQYLSSVSPGMHFSYVDIFRISLEISLRPMRYGFKVLGRACCGSGRLHAQSFCHPNATYCESRDENPQWDYVHPSQAAYKVVADFAYGGSIRFARPFNVRNLVEA